MIWSDDQSVKMTIFRILTAKISIQRRRRFRPSAGHQDIGGLKIFFVVAVLIIDGSAENAGLNDHGRGEIAGLGCRGATFILAAKSL
uniref:Uncharacterized protein n=1 Tax=Romanomermis culicivorax TaxID=13658 RepID=A0A915KSA5_ROMCU